MLWILNAAALLGLILLVNAAWSLFGMWRHLKVRLDGRRGHVFNVDDVDEKGQKYRRRFFGSLWALGAAWVIGTCASVLFGD